MPDPLNQQDDAASRCAYVEGLPPEILRAIDDALPGRFIKFRVSEICDEFTSVLANERLGDAQRVIKAFDYRRIPYGKRMRLDRDSTYLKRVHSSAVSDLLAWESAGDFRIAVLSSAPGPTLEQLVAAQPLTTEAVLRLATRMLEGLQELHRQNIFHGNITGRSVVLPEGDPDAAVLEGFGTPPTGRTPDAAALALNHAHFCSPEAAGAIDYDSGPWSDLYSLGVLLFMAATGAPPFKGAEIGQVLFDHMTAPLPSLASHPMPRAMERFVQHLLQKDPRSRYQSAASALKDAEAILQAVERGEQHPRIRINAASSRSVIDEPKFVGRREELKSLAEALQDAKRGEGGLTLLEAPSGGGKSRMHVELAQLARREGVWVLSGQETDDTNRHSLHLLEGVASDILAKSEQDADTAAELREALHGESATLLSTLPRLAPLLGGADDSGVPERFGESRAVRALVELLTVLGAPERPALVFLDDCQWANAMSLKLLRQWSMRQGGAPRHVAVVVAFRSEEAAPDHPLRRLHADRRLSLKPLSHDEIRELVRSMAGELSDEIVDVVIRLAEGSPFMASAVLRGLHECGALTPSENGWRVDSQKLADCQSSDQAADLLSRRIDLLSDAAVELLSVGAVLGKEFDVSRVADLTKTGPAEFVEALDECKSKRLVWIRPDRTSCVFVHDKIRAAALQRIGESRARLIHRQAAVLLCGLPDSSSAEIAHHFDACGDPRSGLHFALTAAANARSRNALDLAEDQYRIAERGLPPGDQATAYRVYEGLGEVCMLKGNYPEAARCFTHASPLAQGNHARASIRGKLAELSLKRGDMELAAQEYSSALRRLGVLVPRTDLVCAMMLAWQALIQVLHTVAPRLFLHRRKKLPDPSVRLRLDLLSGLSHSCWYGRSRTKMFWAHLAGMNEAERYLPSAELADAYSNHGVGMALFALTSRAETYCQRALDIYTSLSDVWGQGKTLHYWGMVFYGASRFQECIERCRESVRLLEKMGDYQQMHLARYQIAASHYHLGDFANAIEQAQLNRKSGLVTGDTQASGINLEVWARATGGDIPRDVLEAELSRDRSDPQGAAQVTLAGAVSLIRDGRESEAIDLMHEALRNTHGRGVKNFYTIPLLAWLTTAQRSMAERCSPYESLRQRRLLRQTVWAARLGLLQSWACRNDAPRLLREGAIASAMLGRPRRARHKLIAALGVAKRQRARYEFALCLRAYGQIGESLGWPKAAARLASARRTLDLLALRARGDQPSEADSGVASLSLVDRFDTVLESGRSIASSLGAEAIYQQTQQAALRLLRGQECAVWNADARDWSLAKHAVAGNQEPTLRLEHYRELICGGSCWGPRLAPVFSDDGAKSQHGSCLAAPILVRGRITAMMVVAHRELDGLFGEDELRLAEFVTTIAGAALENAAGFQQLQDLNATLEARVTERTAVAEGKARELAASNEELLRVATELREKEEQLRVAMQAAEAASEAKSQFLATMSHEIRTPMNGILGMTELALRSELTPQLATYLKTVKQSGEALLTLLNDVLDLSKIEAGKMEIEQIEFDLRTVVGDAVKLMSAAAAKKNVELLCSVASRAPEVILGDPNRLRQIIVNLVGNAVKFTEAGEVAVSAEVLPKLRRGWVLRFSVRDTGPGVPADKQQKIFEAFQQSDGSTTRKYGGTGLGLSISTELVGMMGGRIWLESEVGTGSTFLFEIPLRVPEGASGPTEVEPVLTDVHAIVVSDCQSAAALYAETLEQQGAEVTVVPPDAQRSALAAPPAERARLAVIDLSNRDDWEPALAAEWSSFASENGWETLWLTPVDWVDSPDHPLDGDRATKPITSRELISSAVRALRLAPADAESAEAPCEQPTRPLRVLLVDDSLVNQQVGVGLLATQGHTITTANDGAEALRALEEAEYDVVLMDLEMPVMDGLQATRRIRERDRALGVHTPIVAMTAHPLHVVREKCQAAEMDACLTKPIQPQLLFQELTKAVDSRAPSV